MSLISRLRARVPRAASQGLVFLSGASLAQLIPAAASPALTRLYHPGDFGTFALIYAIFGVLAPIAGMRYDIAIVLPENEDEAARIAWTAIAASIALGLFTLVVSIAIAVIFPGSRAAGFVIPIIAMLPAGVVLLGLQLVGSSWSVRIHNFRAQSAALLFQAVVMVAVQIALGVIYGSNPYNLIIGTQLGLLASVATFAVALRKNLPSTLKRNFSLPSMLRVAREYVRFPLYTGPYQFAAQATARGVLVILALLATTQIVGQFALAQRVTFLPVATIMGAASQVFYSRAARRLDGARMAAMVRRALIAGPMIVGPPFMIGFLFGKPIFATVFGEAWRQAGLFGVILVAPSMVKTLTAWLDRVYDIRSRQRFALMLEGSSGVITLALLYCALRFTHDPTIAIAVYAATVVVYYVIWLLCTLHVGKFDLSSGIEFCVITLAMAAYMIAGHAVLAWLGAPTILRAAGVILLGLPVMGAGVWLGTRALDGTSEPPSIFSLMRAGRTGDAD